MLDIFVEEAKFQLGIDVHRIPIVVAASVLIYLAFMVLVKIFGTRVLTSMTASDAVIVIMFGAVGGRVILGDPATVSAGVIGLATLMLLEAAFGTIRHYVGWSRFIDRKPVLLMFEGEVMEANASAAHFNDADFRSAIRKAGLGRAEDVKAMILEPTGQVSVIRTGQPIDPAVFADVRGYREIKDRLNNG